MVNIRVRGRVKIREETTDEIMSYEEKYIQVDKEFTDPVEFNKELRTPSVLMDRLTPFSYHTLQPAEYRMSVDFNAVEAIEWAEKVADYREEDTTIDVLTYWLQLFDSMRIRRALHSVLKEEYGIETNVNL